MLLVLCKVRPFLPKCPQLGHWIWGSGWTRLGRLLSQCHAMAMRPLFQAFAYSKRGFTTLQLLVDRYIIGWQSEVELTEDSIFASKNEFVWRWLLKCLRGPLFSKQLFFLAISQVGGHFQLFVSRAGCGVCTVLVHCKDTRRELLLQGGMRWAMGETVETQAKLAEHLRYVIQCEMGIEGYSFLLVSWFSLAWVVQELFVSA